METGKETLRVTTHNETRGKAERIKKDNISAGILFSLIRGMIDRAIIRKMNMIDNCVCERERDRERNRLIDR